MGFIFVSLQAERDLETINDRISAYQSRQSATDFLNKIADKFELLAIVIPNKFETLKK